jgi:hypothetical protein
MVRGKRPSQTISGAFDMTGTICIDLTGKSGEQVLEEYRLRSSAVWGESPLVRLRQIIVAMNSLSYTTQELAAAMGCLAIAIPPEMVKELQEACERRERELRWKMVGWIAVLIGYLGLLYFVFVVLK